MKHREKKKHEKRLLSECFSFFYRIKTTQERIKRGTNTDPRQPEPFLMIQDHF